MKSLFKLESDRLKISNPDLTGVDLVFENLDMQNR